MPRARSSAVSTSSSHAENSQKAARGFVVIKPISLIARAHIWRTTRFRTAFFCCNVNIGANGVCLCSHKGRHYSVRYALCRYPDET